MGETPNTTSETTPAQWVDRHGDALFGYAWLHVRDQQIAEDLVQECFLAALAARERFAGGSSERTWLVGILKHKVFDHFRRRRHGGGSEEALADERIESTAFTDKGFWKARFARWGRDPQKAVETAEFWEVLHRCLARLPRRLSEAFTLREMDDCSSEEICQLLGVNPTNLWARLHRARLGLRQCLDTHWFKRRPLGQADRPG